MLLLAHQWPPDPRQSTQPVQGHLMSTMSHYDSIDTAFVMAI